MTLAAAIRRFAVQMEADGKSPLTVRVYRSELERMGRKVGTRVPVSRIRPETIARYVTSGACRLGPDGARRSARTLHRAKTILRLFFGFLVESRAIRESPARLLQNARLDPPLPVALTEREERQFLHALSVEAGESDLGRRDQVLVTLLLRAGIWDGRRILDAGFVAAGARGSVANPGYGFLWWTNAGDWHLDSGFPDYRRLERPVWPGLPRDAFAFSGLFDQDVTVIPSLDMVVVRIGLPPEPFGDPLGESPGMRPKFSWRFHRLLMSAVTDVDVPDPGPWRYEGAPPPVDPANIFEPTLPPFELTGPPWLVEALAG